MAFLLLCIFVFSGSIGLLPVKSVQAAENDVDSDAYEDFWDDMEDMRQGVGNKIYYAETLEDAIIVFQRNIATRTEKFTIRYLASKQEEYFDFWASDEKEDILNKSGSLYSTGTDGGSDWSGKAMAPVYVIAKGQKWRSINYKFRYDDNEYKEFIAEVRKLIVDCGIANKTDYEKTAWIYDWMCSNISYDRTFTRYTAYEAFEGSAVCQGYAQLFEIFAGELGLTTRYISGEAYGVGSNGVGWGGHAWNIVKLDGKWYQVDTTWGVGDGRKYFLRGDEFFVSTKHKPDFSNLESEIVDNISAVDFTNTSSTQSSSVSARLYNINLDPVDKERLNIGEEYKWLIDNSTSIKLSFENSNPSVVSLTADGKVKALKAGKATLTAVNKELAIKQSIDITVSKEKASLNENDKYYTTVKSAKNISIVYGKTAQIELTLKDEYGVLKNVKYTSKDKSIATVDKNGKVAGIKAGSTTISITCDNGSKVTIKVTVKPLVNKKTATVKVGSKISLRDAIVISKNGYKDLKFVVESRETISITGTTTSSKDIISVSSDGYVTGKKKSTAIVEIYNKSTNKLLGTVKVTVK